MSIDTVPKKIISPRLANSIRSVKFEIVRIDF